MFKLLYSLSTSYFSSHSILLKLQTSIPNWAPQILNLRILRAWALCTIFIGKDRDPHLETLWNVASIRLNEAILSLIYYHISSLSLIEAMFHRVSKWGSLSFPMIHHERSCAMQSGALCTTMWNNMPIVRCGNGVVWYGMIWYDMAWYGMVHYSTA